MATTPRSLAVRALLAASLALPVGLVTAETASAVTSAELEGKVVTSRWLDPSHGGIELGFPQNA